MYEIKTLDPYIISSHHQKEAVLPEEQICNCQEKELQQLKNELHKCKQGNESKARQIKKLDKKVFILMAICVGIGAILGKEALDTIAEWLGTLGEIKGGVDNLTQGAIVPAPGVLPVLAMPLLLGRSRRRK
tara:strand:+ start:309 stop:701 length:393 start_codon:yes stop_codon:yes gene_type:complete